MAEFSLDEMRTAHEKLEARMANACAQSKRSRESVRLIWVSKFHPFSAVKNAIALGATDFGENRVPHHWTRAEQQIKKSGVRCRLHPFYRQHGSGGKTRKNLRRSG